MFRDSILKSPLFAIVVFFILLFLYSTFGPALPFSVLSQQKGEPLVVTETGKATAIPDIANITLGIEESGTSLPESLDAVNKKSKALTESFKKLGINDKDVKTISYNVYPEYDYQSRPLRITGYRVSTSYQVKIKDFDKINDAIVSATAVGANTIGNVNFEVNEETKSKVMTEAREEAINKAKAKAQSLAKAAGISLGKIINISEAQSYPQPFPLTAEKAVGLGAGETAVTPPEITPGETEFTVAVSVSWQIR